MLESKQNGIRSVIREAHEAEGIRVFFKGLSTSLFLVSNPVINYIFYESYKTYTASLNYHPSYDAMIFFIGGAIAKLIATTFTYPYQLIRTKSHVSKSSSYR